MAPPPAMLRPSLRHPLGSQGIAWRWRGWTVDLSNLFWTSSHSWLAYSNAIAPVLSSGAIFDTITVSPDSLAAPLTGGTFSWSQSGNDVLLNYAVVPEPGSLGLLLVGALGVLGRRRRR